MLSRTGRVKDRSGGLDLNRLLAMKAKEVHKLSDDELAVEVKRLRRWMFDLRTQAVTEKIEDTSQFKKTRGDIARLLTEQTARRVVNSSSEKTS